MKLKAEKKNWTKGKHQVYVFIRFPDGRVYEGLANTASLVSTAHAMETFKAIAK